MLNSWLSTDFDLAYASKNYTLDLDFDSDNFNATSDWSGSFITNQSTGLLISEGFHQDKLDDSVL